jgi:dipeptidyl aminopeptidase/acylaminoacyl peptidase
MLYKLSLSLLFCLLALTGCDRPALQTPIAPIITPTSSPTRVNRVLPQAVYLISGGQIWRIAADGHTLHQISHSSSPVLDLAVGPHGDWLAYIQNNVLWRATRQGETPIPLVSGLQIEVRSSVQAYQSPTALHSLLWSPDGSTIAYTQNTLHLAPANGGEPLNITPIIRGTLPLPIELWQPRAMAWASNSQQLLVSLHADTQVALAIYQRATNELLILPNPEGWADVNGSWGLGDGFLYLSGRQHLWLVNTSNGQAAPLLLPPVNTEPFQISFVQQTATGELLSFASSPDETAPGLRMYQTALDGVSNAVFLRNDSYMPESVLWARDLSGALLLGDVPVSDGTSARQLWWLPTDNSAPVLLPLVGDHLQWGIE